MLIFIVFPYGVAIGGSLDDVILKGDWEEVIKILKKDDKKAEDPIARLLMAHAFLATNRNNQSMMLFLSAREKDDLSLWSEWTNSLLSKHPKHPIALYLSADAKARTGKLEEAIKDLSKALEIKPDFALAWNARGNIFILTNKWDDAVGDFMVATRAAPEFADAHASLGTYYVLNEAPDGAIEAFDKAIELNPKFALAYNGRGCAYFGKGEFEKAASDFSMASSLFPSLVIAHSNYGFAFAYASEQIRVAATMKKKPGVSLKSVIETSRLDEFPFKETLKPHKTLLNKNFAFMQEQELSQLIKSFGSKKVGIAKMYQLERSIKELSDPMKKMDRFAKLMLGDKCNSLATNRFLERTSPQAKGWDLYSPLENLPPTSKEILLLNRDLLKRDKFCFARF
jgi:tetratricopeptide (TPR) repeat protein